MAAVFAGGSTPFRRSRTHEGGVCWSQRPVAGTDTLLQSKPALISWFSRDGGGGSVVLCRAGYGALPAFIVRRPYFPRYSAACMAMMRPELLAQEACEPGARETS